jgi:hypothetical protein
LLNGLAIRRLILELNKRRQERAPCCPEVGLVRTIASGEMGVQSVRFRCQPGDP